MIELLVYATPVFLSCIALEAFLTRRRQVRGYSARDTAASLTLALANLGMLALTKGLTLAFFVAVQRYAIFDLPATPWLLLLAIPAEDLTVYWLHRAHHRIRVLWAIHVVHHSSRHLNLGTAVRRSFLEPFTEPFFYVPMALLGFDPLTMLAASGINLIYGFFVHTELVTTLGPLEYVMVTPSHHRVHHGRNPQYLDRNYGVVFIVWDRLFGTFEPEREPVDYGLIHNLDTHNPAKIAFHEWVALGRDLLRARSWGHSLGFALRSPGWRPEASS